MKKRLSTILLAALAVLFIQCSPLKKYESGAQRWESTIQKFEQLDQTESYLEDSILFVGSSSIRRWSTIQEDMAPFTVIQRGYGGAKYSDVAWYAKRIIYPHQFKALIFFVGNDISGSKEDKPPEEVAWLFKTIVGIVREKYPETPIFCIEITPTNRRWNVWPEIKKANRLLKAECDSLPNVYFIETSHRFLGSDGRPKSQLFLKDQLHLNRDGYRLWTGLIQEALKEVLQNNPGQ